MSKQYLLGALLSKNKKKEVLIRLAIYILEKTKYKYCLYAEDNSESIQVLPPDSDIRKHIQEKVKQYLKLETND